MPIRRARRESEIVSPDSVGPYPPSLDPNLQALAEQMPPASYAAPAPAQVVNVAAPAPAPIVNVFQPAIDATARRAALIEVLEVIKLFDRGVGFYELHEKMIARAAELSRP